MSVMVDTAYLGSILRAYGISEQIIAVVPLEETDEGEELRLLYRLDLQSGLRLVCRISREARYPGTLVEQQSRFSEKLRSYGLPTAKKYRVLAGANSFVLDAQGCRVTLEQYVGADLDTVTLHTFFQLGLFLGQIHSVSERDPSPMDYAPMYQAIQQGRATFDRVLARSDPALGQHQDVRAVQALHDALVCRLREGGDRLPRGAVHGDLGAFNNLVTMEGRLFIIDFNLAGEEPFLFDLLSCFYASIYKYAWRGRLQGIDHRQAFSQFLWGYASRRKLTHEEVQQFGLAAALFDGLFYCKAILEEYSDTNDASVLGRFSAALEKFDPSRHRCPAFLYAAMPGGANQGGTSHETH